MRTYVFSGFVFVFLFSGCSVKPYIPPNQVEALTQQLQSLDTKIPHDEALALSKDVFQTASQLRQTFQRNTPPLVHNFLVNIGAKEKGLCYHWSDALYLHLSKQRYASFEFHLVGANIGEYFFEHNALVVMAKQGKIQEGILIDPWRDKDQLYFSQLAQDREYLWKHRPERGCN